MATVVTIMTLERRGDNIDFTVNFETGTDIVVKTYSVHITDDVTLAKVKAMLKAERDRIDALTARAETLQPYVGVPLNLDS